MHGTNKASRIDFDPNKSWLTGEARFEPPMRLAEGFNCQGDGLSVGAFTYSFSHIAATVASIGRYCSISWGIEFAAPEHPVSWLSTSSFAYDPIFMIGLAGDFATGDAFPVRPRPRDRKSRRIEIGDDVWIGAGAYIRGGVRLGTGCIVGTRAVVTKDVEPYTIVAGNPARVVRSRFPKGIVRELLAIEWWRYNYVDFRDIDVTDPAASLKGMRALIAGGLRPYEPDTVAIRAEGRPALPY